MNRWNNLIDLKGDSAPMEVINQRILSDATIEGTNLIVLVMAIMIACIGLNLNSVAVIIGAMLISPLMGGIVATGYGMATYDVPFIRKSLIKLSFQVGLAVLTASIYFLLSPFTSPTDEILARTTPTIWDVLVALCGGIAGAVGNTRKEKSNVIPGVAIATAAANAVSAALLYVRLTRTDKCVRVERKALRIDGASLKRILSIGLPAGVQSAVFSFANIVIQSAINTLGTVAIAASSAAFNVEILAYDVLNSFSQACTTFVGQNYGAGQIKRCKKTMQLSFLEGAIATFVSVVVLLLSARSLLAIFNSDPEVIAIGYIRLATILPAYVFCLIYEILSGYLRGFGISLAPALLTMLGVCGIRIAWVKFVFPTSMTFQTVMWVYPISLGATAMLILCAVLIYRPSRRFAGLETEEEDK